MLSIHTPSISRPIYSLHMPNMWYTLHCIALAHTAIRLAVHEKWTIFFYAHSFTAAGVCLCMSMCEFCFFVLCCSCCTIPLLISSSSISFYFFFLRDFVHRCCVLASFVSRLHHVHRRKCCTYIYIHFGCVLCVVHRRQSVFERFTRTCVRIYFFFAREKQLCYTDKQHSR